MGVTITKYWKLEAEVTVKARENLFASTEEDMAQLPIDVNYPKMEIYLETEKDFISCVVDDLMIDSLMNVNMASEQKVVTKEQDESQSILLPEPNQKVLEITQDDKCD